jgi:DnaJ-class molecular chaperone
MLDIRKILNSIRKCEFCNGTGEHRAPFGRHVRIFDCPKCNGLGVVPKDVAIIPKD